MIIISGARRRAHVGETVGNLPVRRNYFATHHYFRCAAQNLFPALRHLALAPADLAAIACVCSEPTAGGRFCSQSPCGAALAAAAWSRPALRRADRLRQQTADVLAHRHRPKAGHAMRIVEVPRVLDQPDEVANRRIGGPGATKRRTREVRRNSGFEKRADVGFRRDRFDRRQAGRIERSLGAPALSLRLAACRRAAQRPSPRAARARPSLRACAATTDQEIFPARSCWLSVAHRRAPPERFRIGAVALAFDERLLDMVLGDEAPQRVAGSPPASAPARSDRSPFRSGFRLRPGRRSPPRR